MASAVIAAGTERYSDPWHAFVTTSHIISETLMGDGWDVEVETDVDRALTLLGDADLLVVNAGDPWRNGETGRGAPRASVQGLDAALDRGIGVLAVHNAVSSLRDYPRWRQAIGGEWVVGESGHPEISSFDIAVHSRGHRITRGAADFTLFDERYTGLARDPETRVLLSHDVDGERHPTLWIHRYGRSRTVVSTLGHDERSFESEDHRRVVIRAAAWAAAGG